MEMGFSSFKFIFFKFATCIIPFVLDLVVSEQTIFECHGDVCNVGKVPQFCSSAYKLCRDCHEIKGDCGTAAQPLNCTGYCQEIAVAEALKQIKERDEKSCWVVPVMLNIANGFVSAPQHNDSRIAAGSGLMYNCHDGYTLEGPDTLICNGNETWTPTIMPYCFKNTWIGYRKATIGLSVICVIELAAIISICCYKRKKNEKTISRTCTDSSIHHDVEALLGAENQSVHDEHETPSVLDGASGREHSTDEETSPLTAPASPSAPPAEPDKDERDGQESLNTSSSPSRDTRGHRIIINNHVLINNQAIVENFPMPPETHGKNKTRNDNFPYDPTRINQKRIDEKMPTEESDEVNAVEETTDEKKGRGTKPLPARDADSQTRAESTQEMFEEKESTYKGPQPLPAAKEENIQSPTKESGEGNSLDMVGIQNCTFPKSDIRSTDSETKVSKAKLREKLEDLNSTQKLADLKDA
ncbi:uncharacterized protein LOC123530972 [Mercenaria mercenaria]|uniref:uncharacterized protein LOC123530972 n=1 Tax=Mercenaria mercenaria TaxID=6596 RepID=UPI00234F1E63|nr:uncharacterized protein LOC123530972 [Mercenaria mercenaria]